jgi:hypothetical protein
MVLLKWWNTLFAVVAVFILTGLTLGSEVTIPMVTVYLVGCLVVFMVVQGGKNHDYPGW